MRPSRLRRQRRHAGSAGGTNYTGFTVNRGGHLRPLGDSTVTLPDTSQPGDVLFSPDGRKPVGDRLATSLIDSFTVGRGGLPAAAPGSPLAAQGLGPFGSEFRPTNAAQLYVTNAHDGANAGTVSAFAAGGALTTIAASPFRDEQIAPCWVEISHDGQYLFAVNTASGSISSYSIASGGSLTLLTSTSVNAAATPEDARLSPDGSTLWVVDATADAVSGFAVNRGTLTEPPHSRSDRGRTRRHRCHRRFIAREAQPSISVDPPTLRCSAKRARRRPA
ncbi:MAG TPA: beta-propeller fold lactonase family protein [Gaiellales bacterium]|nr:beta-propeller fold lactonase family protein [Gaiellales bacterium]